MNSNFYFKIGDSMILTISHLTNFKSSSNTRVLGRRQLSAFPKCSKLQLWRLWSLKLSFGYASRLPSCNGPLDQHVSLLLEQFDRLLKFVLRTQNIGLGPERFSASLVFSLFVFLMTFRYSCPHQIIRIFVRDTLLTWNRCSLL